MSLQRIARQIDRLVNAQEKKIVNNYRDKVRKLRELIRKQYDKHEIAGQLLMSDMTKYDRISDLDKKLEKLIRELYRENSTITRLTLRQVYTDTYRNTMSYVEGETGRTIRGILKSANVTETINERMAGIKWAERYGRHRNEAIYNIQRAVKQGLEEGDTFSTMSNRLRQAMEGDVLQPTRVVRTESKRVQAKSQKDSLDHAFKQGVEMIKTWRTSKDERVRDKHEPMEGVTVPYEDDFILPDGTRTFAPGLSGVAEHDIHERCFMEIEFI